MDYAAGGSGVGGYMLEGDLPADAVRRALVSGDDPPVVDPPADKPPVDAPAGDFFVRP